MIVEKEPYDTKSHQLNETVEDSDGLNALVRNTLFNFSF